MDPIEGGCSNAYAYVYGDPINDQDLSGMISWKKIGCGIQRVGNRVGSIGGIAALGLSGAAFVGSAFAVLNPVTVALLGLAALGATVISVGGHVAGGVAGVSVGDYEAGAVNLGYAVLGGFGGALGVAAKAARNLGVTAVDLGYSATGFGIGVVGEKTLKKKSVC